MGGTRGLIASVRTGGKGATVTDRLRAEQPQTTLTRKWSERASWRQCNRPQPSWMMNERSALRRWSSGSGRHVRRMIVAAREMATGHLSTDYTGRRVP